jgi:hypothetical protein
MVIMKAVLIGVLVSGLLGFGAFLAYDVSSMAWDILDDWGNGSGCERGNSYHHGENNPDSDCHGEFCSNGEDRYCPHHDEYLSEEEKGTHREECPLNEDND